MWSLTLNLAVATIWLLLSEQPSLTVFATGFGIGLALVAAFRPLLPSDRYLPRLGGLARFLLVFVWEFIRANVEVLHTVLFRPLDTLQPGFVSLDVSDLKPWETLLLSHCITLTPGSCTVDVADDYRRLLIHSMDAADPDRVRDEINRTLKASILAFTR